MNRIVCAAAALILSIPCFAQSKNVSGHFVGDPGARAITALVAPFEAEPQAVEPLPFLVPRWDGTDDAGNAYPWSHLRGVAVSIRHRQTVNLAGENVSSHPADLWQVETGTRVYFSRLDGSREFGGGSYTSKVAASHGLSAFDGELDGAGTSGWDVSHSSTPIAYEIVDVGTNREDLRAWCGAGDVLLSARIEEHTISNGMPGHWRRWSSTSIEVLDIEPGAQIHVRYILGPPIAAGATRVETSPWFDLGLIRSGDQPFVDLPGAQGDPSQLVATWLEFAEEGGKTTGLENLSPFSATCGGYASGGMRIERDGVYVSGLWSNHASGAGSPGPMQPFDGSVDWSGLSGLESWQGANWTVYRRATVAPSMWAQDVRIGARVTHDSIAPASVTPGGEFAWWGSYRFSGRVRVGRLYLQ